MTHSETLQIILDRIPSHLATQATMWVDNGGDDQITKTHDEYVREGLDAPITFLTVGKTGRFTKSHVDLRTPRETMVVSIKAWPLFRPVIRKLVPISVRQRFTFKQNPRTVKPSLNLKFVNLATGEPLGNPRAKRTDLRTARSGSVLQFEFYDPKSGTYLIVSENQIVQTPDAYKLLWGSTYLYRNY